MSELICKQCKESYNTSWGYHNEDYCIRHCHIESLEADKSELKATLSVIREKISDATYHGKASFSACLSYIDVLAKDKLEQANKQER